jgi:hypothetical protein
VKNLMGEADRQKAYSVIKGWDQESNAQRGTAEGFKYVCNALTKE